MSDDYSAGLAAALRSRPARTVTVPGARPAAVLVPVIGGSEPALLLTVRTTTVSSHKSQVSFPGGAVDPADPSPAAAAVREAREELGIEPSAVRILGELDWIHAFVSGYVVAPVVGWLDRLPPLDPNPAEVAHTLVVPLGGLMGSARRAPGFRFDGRTYPTGGWIHDGFVIWGVTAAILDSFLEVAGGASAPSRRDDRPA